MIESSSFKEGMLLQQTCKVNEELGYRRIETNLEQYTCCSRCCNNPGEMTDWISRTTTKRWRSKVFKNRGYTPHTLNCPNFEL